MLADPIVDISSDIAAAVERLEQEAVARGALRRTETGWRHETLDRVRLTVLTTTRELLEEGVGLPPAQPSAARIEGNVAHLARRIADPRDPLSVFEFTGIIVDDHRPSPLAADVSFPYHRIVWPSLFASAVPAASRRPPRVVNLPANWKQLRHDPELQAAARRRHELAILRQLQRWNTDLVCCDRYMARVGTTLLGAYGGDPARRGAGARLVNCHPGIASELPGRTPTADALARHKRESAYVTGTTIHCIDESLDLGAPILAARHTAVRPTDTAAALRTRCYEVESALLAVALLRHLADAELAAAVSRARRVNRRTSERSTAESADCGAKLHHAGG